MVARLHLREVQSYKIYSSKINLARDCNRCHHIESPTAGTMFHKVKFGIRKAFTIVFEMSATTKSISSSQMAKRLNIRYNTAWLFMHKVRIAMKSSGNFPMTGTVVVDEFVFGGKGYLKLILERMQKDTQISGQATLSYKEDL